MVFAKLRTGKHLQSRQLAHGCEAGHEDVFRPDILWHDGAFGDKQELNRV